MAKLLFIFTFLFLLDLLYRKECGKVSHYKCYISHSHTKYIESHKVTSHDKCGKVAHRPCSSCISSVENLIGTSLSSPCQLGLGVGLSCLG